MKLFLGTNCPQCEALKKRIDLTQAPDLEVYLIPDSGVAANGDEAAALSEADYHDVYSVPALVSDLSACNAQAGGRTVHDVFEILEALQGAMEGAAHGG